MIKPISSDNIFDPGIGLDHLTQTEKEKLNSALSLALELHADQEDRPDGPYTHHILRVTARIANYFEIKDVDIIVAALLHDSVEDQAEKLCKMGGEKEVSVEKALQFIREKFGQRVAHIVDSVTNPLEINSTDKEQRNKNYVTHVAKTIQDPEVFYVKLSDFSDNGMNLESLQNKQQQLSLSKKYFPLYDIFINRLQKTDIKLSTIRKEEIISRLVTVKLFAAALLAS